MLVETQCEFASIYFKLHKGSYSPSDIADMINIIRMNRKLISDESKIQLLQIPLNILKNQCELTSTSWANDNGYYFSGNASEIEQYREFFASENFTLETLCDFLKAIISDKKYLNSDFLLRNVEVTLRDDVKPKKYSQFQESGLIYARIMEKAFEL